MLAVCGLLVPGAAHVKQGSRSASLADEAKRWFECSTVLCRFVPDGRLRAEKVCPTTTTKHAHNTALLRPSPDIQSLHRIADALHRSTGAFPRLMAIHIVVITLFLYRSLHVARV